MVQAITRYRSCPLWARVITHFGRMVNRPYLHAVREMSCTVLQYRGIGHFFCHSALFLFLLGAEIAHAQINPDDTFVEELHLTLQESIEIALEQNVTLLNSRLDREIGKLNYQEEEKTFDPKFSVNLNPSVNRSEGNVDLDAGITFKLPTGSTARVSLNANKNITANDSGTDTYSVTFIQPLLKGAGFVQGTDTLRLARQREITDILGFRDTIASVIDSVVRAYHSLIQSNMSVQISEGALERARKQSNVTKALIKAGRTAQLELTRSQSTITQSEIALLEAKNSRNTNSSRLSDLLNLPNDIRLVPKEGSFDELSEEDIGGLVDLEASTRQALDNSTALRTAVFRVENAEIGRLNAKNNLLPNLDFDTTVTRNDAVGKTTHTAKLTLSMPLIDPDRKSKFIGIERAENELVKARRNLEAQRESIRRKVRNSVYNVERRHQDIQLSREARELAEKNLAIEQAKFEQGLSSSFQVASSQDDLLRAQNAEINAVIAYRDAKLTLHQDMGITLDVWGIEVEEIAP